jgi:hypothetical protein
MPDQFIELIDKAQDDPDIKAHIEEIIEQSFDDSLIGEDKLSLFISNLKKDFDINVDIDRVRAFLLLKEQIEMSIPITKAPVLAHSEPPDPDPIGMYRVVGNVSINITPQRATMSDSKVVKIMYRLSWSSEYHLMWDQERNILHDLVNRGINEEWSQAFKDLTLQPEE